MCNCEKCREVISVTPEVEKVLRPIAMSLAASLKCAGTEKVVALGLPPTLAPAVLAAALRTVVEQVRTEIRPEVLADADRLADALSADAANARAERAQARAQLLSCVLGAASPAKAEGPSA